MSDDLSELIKKIDFVVDVINLCEIEKIIPSELIDRSRNRIKIEELKARKNDNELKKCLEKELKYQKNE